MEHYASLTAWILGSLGGAGFIVVALSSWLGRVWATRLMDNQRHSHQQELEELRSNLRAKNDEQLISIRKDYEIFKETHLREHNDKLLIYRACLDIVASLLAKIELTALGKRVGLTDKEQEAFETERLRLYAYLAMLAPQEVMDANDNLIDMLLALIYDGKGTTWANIREAALKLTNSMRADIGINKAAVSYNGAR